MPWCTLSTPVPRAGERFPRLAKTSGRLRLAKTNPTTATAKKSQLHDPIVSVISRPRSMLIEKISGT